MTSKDAIMIQKKTQKIIESLWQCDPLPLLEYIDDDVTLIEPGRNVLLQGREKIRSILPRIMEDIRKSTLRRHNFMVTQNCGNACTIIGQYDLDDGHSVKSQSCVCVWESTPGGELLLKHIGITRPDETTAPEPVTTPVRNSMPDRRTPRIVVTDQNDCTRFLYPQDILFATSDGRNTIIRCAGDTINARLNITEFIAKSGSRFLPVHRCYVVNVEHITLIKPYCVILSDGSEIPVPVKRYSEIKHKITEMMNSL